MKLKTLKLEGNTAETANPRFSKLGKHSFLVNDNLLVLFIKREQDFDCIFYQVSPVNKKELTDDYVGKVKTALTKIHKKILEKIEAKSAGQNTI